jgi:hypothetical protein
MCGFDINIPEQVPVMAYFENSNEPSGFIEGSENFLTNFSPISFSRRTLLLVVP